MRNSIRGHWRLLGVAILLLVGAIIGGKIFFSDSVEADSLTGEREAIEALQQELQQIKAKMNVTEKKSSFLGMKINQLENRRDNSLAQKGVVERERENNVAEEAGTSARGGQDAAEVKVKRQIAAIEDVLREEQTDRAWADNASDSLLQVYTGDSFENLDVEVECKRTLCQIDFNVLNEKDRGWAMKRIVADAPWKAPGFTKYDMDVGKGTFYLAREGHRLPGFEDRD